MEPGRNIEGCFQWQNVLENNADEAYGTCMFTAPGAKGRMYPPVFRLRLLLSPSVRFLRRLTAAAPSAPLRATFLSRPPDDTRLPFAGNAMPALRASPSCRIAMRRRVAPCAADAVHLRRSGSFSTPRQTAPGKIALRGTVCARQRGVSWEASFLPLIWMEL